MNPTIIPKKYRENPVDYHLKTIMRSLGTTLAVKGVDIKNEHIKKTLEFIKNDLEFIIKEQIRKDIS